LIFQQFPQCIGTTGNRTTNKLHTLIHTHTRTHSHTREKFTAFCSRGRKFELLCCSAVVIVDFVDVVVFANTLILLATAANKRLNYFHITNKSEGQSKTDSTKQNKMKSLSILQGICLSRTAASCAAAIISNFA